MSDSTRWALDRKVPLAVLGVLLSQIFLFGWFLSNHESRITNLEQKNNDLVVMMQTINERMTEITINAGETRIHLQYLAESVKEITKILKEDKAK